MRKLLTKIHRVLNELKGFNAGIHSGMSDTIVIEYEGEYYTLELTKVQPVEVTEHMRKKYNCEDNFIVIAELLDRLSKE